MTEHPGQTSALTDRARFDLIRYANCWEDADLLVSALAPEEGARILSIASGGDNSLALLACAPSLLAAVDLSLVQLFLVELKARAIGRLEREDCLAFLGLEPSSDRLAVYKGLRSELSMAARAFWDSQSEALIEGVIFHGKFERYFRFFRRRLLPFIHGPGRVAGLFAPKSQAEQEVFYDRHWNNRRWRLFFQVFFSRKIMGRYGRDPAFLQQVRIPVSQYLFDRAAAHLRSTDCQENYFLRFILLGNFGPTTPRYLRPEFYLKVRQNLGALRLVHGDVSAAFAGGESYEAFNLSNIFEYMDAAVFVDVAEALAGGAAGNARIAYWNLMAPRRLSEALPGVFQPALRPQIAAARVDKGFFYKEFLLEEKAT